MPVRSADAQANDSGNVYICVCNNTQCEPGAVCTESGECEQISCTGDSVCINNSQNKGIKYICNDGKIDISNPTPCTIDENPVSCNDEKNDCGECLNSDDVSCTNNENIGTIVTCSHGKLNKETCLGTSCNATNDGCGDCRNGEITCENDENGYGYTKTCKDGAFSDTSKDPCKDGDNHVSCNESLNICGKCLNGVTCDDDNEDKLGYLEICIDGMITTDVCPSVSCNVNKTDCGACINGKVKCSNEDNIGKPLKCVNGAYSLALDNCKTGEGANQSPVSCNETNDGCGECQNGDIVCVNDTNNIGMIKRCRNGKYEKRYCDNNYSCKDDKACGSCRDETTVCKETLISDSQDKFVGKKAECINGAYGDYNNCPQNSHCLNENLCMGCIEGEIRCKNDENGVGYYNQCKADGTFTDKVKCDNDYSCNHNGTKCGECNNNTGITCRKAPNSEIGQLYSCENGAYKIEDCPNDASCNSEETGCGNCKNGTTKCENNAQQNGIESTCQNGHWEEKHCDSANSCNGNKCGNCHNLGTTCNDDTISSICTNGKLVKYKLSNGLKMFCTDENNFLICSNGTPVNLSCSIFKPNITVNNPVCHVNSCIIKTKYSIPSTYTSSSFCHSNADTALLFNLTSPGDRTLSLTFDSTCPANRCNSTHTQCSMIGIIDDPLHPDR